MEKITISSFDWTAEVLPQRGANLAVLRYKGKDILRPFSEEKPDPYLMGAPLLLPANRTKEGHFVFDGKEYFLPVNEPKRHAHLHGFLHQQEFTVTERTGDRVWLEYENQGEIYPFPFRMKVCYQLSGEGALCRYVIENCGETSMPVIFALHTTFVEPDIFQVPLAARQERDEYLLPTGRYLPLNEMEQTFCTGAPSRGQEIAGYYRASGDTARIGRNIYYQVKGFDHWIVFNGQGRSGLICIEPQLGPVNGLNDEANCPVIWPGESLELETRFGVEEK